MSAIVPPKPSGARNPGSQSALRERNQQRVIDALLGNGPLTQAELARGTGLSTATVSNIVKAMAAVGSIETEPTTSSGRRALLVRLSNNDAVAVGVDFGRRHLRIVLASVGFAIIDELFVELPLGHRAEESIDRASTLLAKLLAKNDVASSAVLGVGVGIPGPIDQRTGTVVQGAILPEWVGIHLHDLEKENITHLYSTLPILFKLEWGTHAGAGFALGGEIAVGKGFAMIFRKHGFWVECVDMRWAAIHKQENDSLGFARQRRKFGRERIYG